MKIIFVQKLYEIQGIEGLVELVGLVGLEGLEGNGDWATKRKK